MQDNETELARAISHLNALMRLRILVELEENPAYPNNYEALIATIDEMERDLL